MNSYKALKKLKKVAKVKPESRSARQLAALRVSASDATTQQSLSAEMQGVLNNTAQSVLHELSMPFKPLLSWFNDASGSVIPVGTTASKPDRQKRQLRFVAHTAKPLNMQPAKSPPCKRCPALAGGVCQCAVKRGAVKKAAA